MSRLTLKLKDLIKIQIFFILVIEGLISLLHVPSFFRYIIDINFLFMLFWIIIKKQFSCQYKFFPKDCRKIFVYIIVFMLMFTLIAITKLVPFGQILWGIRNTFFPLIFLLICALGLGTEDVEQIFSVILKLQVVNFLCGLYEFFVLDVHNDYLGGMFGTALGCNGSLNAYLVIICAYILTRFIQKKVSGLEVGWIFLSSIIMATLAELKVFYIELIFIIFLGIWINKKSLKSFMMLVVGMFSLFIGMLVLTNVNSESVRFLTSLESIIEYNSRTDYDGDIVISRLTSFEQINEYFFDDKTSTKILGYGLGSCEDSQTFEWFNSDFAEQYRDMRYRYLTVAMNYLETGYMGVVAFLLVFIAIFFLAHKYQNIIPRNEITGFAQILCVLYVFTCWYDSSIRSYSGYIMYFTISSIFIYAKSIKMFETKKYT